MIQNPNGLTQEYHWVKILMAIAVLAFFQKDTYGLRHECLSQNVGVTIM